MLLYIYICIYNNYIYELQNFLYVLILYDEIHYYSNSLSHI